MTPHDYESRYWDLNELVVEIQQLHYESLKIAKKAKSEGNMRTHNARMRIVQWTYTMGRHYERLMYDYQPCYAPNIGFICITL